MQQHPRQGKIHLTNSDSHSFLMFGELLCELRQLALKSVCKRQLLIITHSCLRMCRLHLFLCGFRMALRVVGCCLELMAASRGDGPLSIISAVNHSFRPWQWRILILLDFETSLPTIALLPHPGIHRIGTCPYDHQPFWLSSQPGSQTLTSSLAVSFSVWDAYFVYGLSLLVAIIRQEFTRWRMAASYFPQIPFT
jgi:hypothetical protein